MTPQLGFRPLLTSPTPLRKTQGSRVVAGPRPRACKVRDHFGCVVQPSTMGSQAMDAYTDCRSECKSLHYRVSLYPALRTLGVNDGPGLQMTVGRSALAKQLELKAKVRTETERKFQTAMQAGALLRPDQVEKAALLSHYLNMVPSPQALRFSTSPPTHYLLTDGNRRHQQESGHFRTRNVSGSQRAAEKFERRLRDGLIFVVTVLRADHPD